VAVGGDLEPVVHEDGGAAPLGPPSLERGARVFVPRLRAEAEVLEVLADGTVRVQAGAIKVVLAASELQKPPHDSEARRRIARADAGAKRTLDPAGLEAPIQTTDNTCDLRGLRADDAVSLAATFLDRSLNENRRVCFLVHGHGTGALKEAIRRELKASPYVRFYRPGLPGEGGDGVTIAWLL
jgi:DNA mismatch repair protein MutS2